jgi:hypothetical protein
LIDSSAIESPSQRDDIGGNRSDRYAELDILLVGRKTFRLDNRLAPASAD